MATYNVSCKLSKAFSCPKPYISFFWHWTVPFSILVSAPLIFCYRLLNSLTSGKVKYSLQLDRSFFLLCIALFLSQSDCRWNLFLLSLYHMAILSKNSAHLFWASPIPNAYTIKPSRSATLFKHVKSLDFFMIWEMGFVSSFFKPVGQLLLLQTLDLLITHMVFVLQRRKIGSRWTT